MGVKCFKRIISLAHAYGTQRGDESTTVSVSRRQEKDVKVGGGIHAKNLSLYSSGEFITLTQTCFTAIRKSSLRKPRNVLAGWNQSRLRWSVCLVKQGQTQFCIAVYWPQCHRNEIFPLEFCFSSTRRTNGLSSCPFYFLWHVTVENLC